MVDVMDMSRDTAVLYVRVAFAPVELVVMDDEIWISGAGVFIIGELPAVTDPSSSENRKIVPVTGQ